MKQNTLQHTPVHKVHSEIIKLFHQSGYKLHPNNYGPKIFSSFQRMALVMLFRRSGKALRDFISSLYESRWPSWLDLREIPAKSTLHDWCKRFTLTEIRAMLEKFTAKQKPKHMAVDSTGIDSWQRSRHYEKRILAPNMPYAKLDILVDTDTLLAYDFVLRTKPRHDVLGAETMFKRNKFKDVLVFGDGAYDSEPLHNIAKENDLTLFAKVRKSPKQRPRGLNRKRCAKGHKKYNQRSKVESVIHSLKARYVPQLRSKMAHMKKREIAWILLAYNLEKMTKSVARQIWKMIYLIIPDRARDYFSLNSIYQLS